MVPNPAMIALLYEKLSRCLRAERRSESPAAETRQNAGLGSASRHSSHDQEPFSYDDMEQVLGDDELMSWYRRHPLKWNSFRNGHWED